MTVCMTIADGRIQFNSPLSLLSLLYYGTGCTISA